MSDPQLPPPGWYDDPYGAPMVRWWDGTTWTDQVAPPPDQGPAGPGGTVGGHGLSDIGTWLSETFRRLGTRIGNLFAIISIVQLITAMVVGLGLWLALRGFRLEIVDQGDTADSDVEGGAAAALGGAVALFGGLFGFAARGAVTHQLASADREPGLPWSASAI